MKIGKYEAKYPLIQGGMGVRISGGSLAGHVARCGGIGIVASAGIALNSGLFNERNYVQADSDALKAELRKAYEIAPNGIVGVNVMVALSDFESLEKASIDGGAKIIICGAGLPMTLPGVVAALVLVFVPVVGAFITPDIMGGGKVEMIGTLINRQFSTARNWPFGSSISLILMLLVLVGVIAYFRSGGEDARRAL